MNKICIFYINAFTRDNSIFSGNPAAVCVLPEFLSDELMLAIAGQNNLAETAFIVAKDNNFLIRWFAPKEEVTLCGHGTLAAAHVVFNYLKPELNKIIFQSPLHTLQAERSDDFITLDFPTRAIEKIKVFPELKNTVTADIEDVFVSPDDYYVVLKNQHEIENIAVDLHAMRLLDKCGVVFTAKGDTVDFVSRVFNPKLGIDEDPVTGSAHCLLAPYWSQILKKQNLHALQLSERCGELFCELQNDRVLLKGRCQLYLKGEIF